MFELADGLHFPLEPGHGVGVFGSFPGQHLDGNHLLQPGVQSLIDGAHATLAQFGQQLVLTQLPQVGQILRFRRLRARK